MASKPKDALQGAVEKSRDKIEEAGMDADRMLGALELKGEEVAEDTFQGDTRASKAAQTATVISVVAIGVTAAVGILIYSQVNSSLSDPENSDLNNSSNSVTEGFGSAMELVPTVLIVLVAAVVIGVIQRLR